MSIKKEKEVFFGIYKHYKGNIYLVTDYSNNSETNEMYIEYYDIKGKKWNRPMKMFLEIVDIDGIKKQRFEYMDEKSFEEYLISCTKETLIDIAKVMYKIW